MPWVSVGIIVRSRGHSAGRRRPDSGGLALLARQSVRLFGHPAKQIISWFIRWCVAKQRKENRKNITKYLLIYFFLTTNPHPHTKITKPQNQHPPPYITLPTLYQPIIHIPNPHPNLPNYPTSPFPLLPTPHLPPNPSTPLSPHQSKHSSSIPKPQLYHKLTISFNSPQTPPITHHPSSFHPQSPSTPPTPPPPQLSHPPHPNLPPSP